MELWSVWMACVIELRGACSRLRCFLWMTLAIAAMSIRTDLAGVTSFVRVFGLQAYCYDRLLDFFHSGSLNLEKLTLLWVKLVLKIFSPLLINQRYVLVGDGIKIPKEGRKMPAVKSLHQESDSNTKPEYIMGHSCQAVALLVSAAASFFAVPLACRIHEGLVFSNRDTRTLLDKMILLLKELKMPSSFYFVADAYYCARNIIHGLMKDGNHLVSRLKINASAYLPLELIDGVRGRGRPKVYGEKIKIKRYFNDEKAFETIQSPVYGEMGVSIRYRAIQLLWRRAGIMALYVLVIHPHRGRIMLLTTDLTLSPIDVIKLYGLRYKIELSFKQALRVIGVYSYHFWMMSMDKISRRSGKQYLHHKSKAYRQAIVRKMGAYHRYIQIGLIAQGLLQYLACSMPQVIWKNFNSWLRTIRTGIPPSEQTTAIALRNSLPEFLANRTDSPIFKKFLLDRTDFERGGGLMSAA